jgi:ubiquitin-conjugating enzyme E2 O
VSPRSTSFGAQKTASSTGTLIFRAFTSRQSVLTFSSSRLYNEKAFVLSRGFVRRALEIPLGSLEAEINWLYYKQGKLVKVVADARALIQKSRDEPVDSKVVVATDRAVPRLTGGAIITLERTLAKLEGLQRAAP